MIKLPFLALVAVVGLSCAPAPVTSPPPAVMAPPPPAGPDAGDLARRALACPLLESGDFAPGCEALATFLAPAVLRTGAGRAALLRLVSSSDVKDQSLAARGYAALVDKQTVLTVKELSLVLALFGKTTRLPVVTDLGPPIRITVTASPQGPEAAALAAFLAIKEETPLDVRAYGARAESLLRGRDLTEITVPMLLFRGTGSWGQSQGRQAILESEIPVAQKCATLEADLAGDGDPEQGFTDMLRHGCPDGPVHALPYVVKRAKEATWFEAAQLIVAWPFESVLPACAEWPELRSAIVGALREVLAGGPNVEAKIREKAFDDLAVCDRQAAQESAKGYLKDRDQVVADTAKLLLRPEPKAKVSKRKASR